MNNKQLFNELLKETRKQTICQRAALDEAREQTFIQRTILSTIVDELRDLNEIQREKTELMKKTMEEFQTMMSNAFNTFDGLLRIGK